MVTLNSIQLKKWQDDNAERLRYKYDDVKQGEICLDIGSYQREWGKWMYDRYGVITECFDALDNRAAWTHEGELEMGGAFYYTSMHDDKGKQKFKCVDIAPYLKQEIAVCKINIEGGEYELLPYIIKNGIENIRNLQVQFHLIDGMDCDAAYIKIHDELCKTHSLTWRYPFVWENWRRND